MYEMAVETAIPSEFVAFGDVARNLRIHRDDVEAFVEVVQAHRRATGQIP